MEQVKVRHLTLIGYFIEMDLVVHCYLFELSVHSNYCSVIVF